MKKLVLIFLLIPSFFYSQMDSACYLIPDVGPCFAAIPKYYYDQNTQQCETFLWGGCAGVVPFNTLLECESSCGNSSTNCTNLLLNPDAELGLVDWNFSTGTGTDWVIQGSSFGSSSFVSSYNWSTKNQTIDLLANGFSTTYLDSEPLLYVQEMYTGHTVDFSDQYYLHVELRDASGTVLASFDDGTQSNPLIADTSWKTSNHVFSSYGPGLRTIYIESGGNDAEYWAGYYGTKIDEAEVKFITQGTDTQIACNSFTWIDGNTYTSNNNTATYMLTNSSGCDSLVTLDLTINTLNNVIINNSPTLSSNTAGAIYQWLDCDNNYAQVNGATNQSFTATSNGNYALALTYNNCTDTSACEPINNVSILENSFKKAPKIFPNPTSGKLTIELDDIYDKINLTLRTIEGKIISSNNVTFNNTITLEIKEKPGIYIIEISNNEDKSARLRVIKY
jgi:hypothetical protein